jgi:exosortase
LAAVAHPAKTELPWTGIAWFGALLIVCFAPVLRAMAVQWWVNPDMGHAWFVPVVSGYIVWQKRAELAAMTPQPNWWGLALVIFSGFQLIAATLGVELFVARTAVVEMAIGVVWMLGGTAILKKLAFPLLLLFFIVPIPTILYTRITFPLQIKASQLAEWSLTVINIPVVREGNVLELPNHRLAVVEACSGIRSLLTLTYLSLVFGYFFEPRRWLRVLLFLATIPVAILANGGRVAITGILTQIKPEWSEGFFHESTGFVMFFGAAVILVLFHWMVARIYRRISS